MAGYLDNSCICGHKFGEHEDCGIGECIQLDCDCRKFQPAIRLAEVVELARSMGALDAIAFRQTFQTFLGYKLPGDMEYGPGHQINLSGGAEMILVIRFPFATAGPALERLTFPPD